jgi:glycolate oxidase iron-sulfur subunit
MHLVDHGRAYIEETYTRPLADRLLRTLLAVILPRPSLFRVALVLGWLARPLAGIMPDRLRAMLRLTPAVIPNPSAMDKPQVFPAQGGTRLRVALLTGCAQQVLAPQINEATIRLLTRLGCEVAVAAGAGCCGSLVHHLGRADEAHGFAAANIRAWTGLWDGRGPDRVVINASGCGTTVKDYGHMFRADKLMSAPAARLSAMARDVSEVVAELGLTDVLDRSRSAERARLKVAYHSACSLQHGQGIDAGPKALLAAAGFGVREIPEGHLCCGSAGTYNMLQPRLATDLRDRKIGHIERLRPDVVAAGNIGCMSQIASGTAIPLVHTVELLDWATGGPKPAALGPTPLAQV